MHPNHSLSNICQKYRDKKCLSINLIYKATITQDNNKTETYTGLTSTTFKARLGTHKSSFKNPDANQTSLSRRINMSRKKNITHSIKWEKVSSAKPFSPLSGICSLCTTGRSDLEIRPRPRVRLDNHNYNYVLSLFTGD